MAIFDDDDDDGAAAERNIKLFVQHKIRVAHSVCV